MSNVASTRTEGKRDLPARRRVRRKRAERPVLTALPETGLLKLSSFVPSPIFDMGRSTFWKMVAAGIAPQPVRLAAGGTFWRAEDLRTFLKSLESSA